MAYTGGPLLFASGAAADHPVLAAFLQEEARMRGLECIPAVIEWQNLLLARFNRRIDHQSALKMTVGQVIQVFLSPSRRAT